jgi:hypothetical protein
MRWMDGIECSGMEEGGAQAAGAIVPGRRRARGQEARRPGPPPPLRLHLRVELARKGVVLLSLEALRPQYRAMSRLTP